MVFAKKLRKKILKIVLLMNKYRIHISAEDHSDLCLQQRIVHMCKIHIGLVTDVLAELVFSVKMVFVSH